jgi:hypothetical protein
VSRRDASAYQAHDHQVTPGVVSGGAAPAVEGHIPDFFVVGQPKSGTTALWEMLRRHPQIYMPDNKEPWFLASELRDRTPPRPGGTPETLEQYLALFDAARADQRAGEASALYLWSRTAASRIAELQPAARIIAILREPASLLRSLHLQFLQTHIETESDLRTAIGLEEARRDGRDLPSNTYWPQALLYSDHVRYVDQLRRFYAEFPPEQVLVLLYDDFRADNEGTVRTVLRFLDVDDEAPIEVRRANPTVSVRSRRLHGLLQSRGPLARTIRTSAKALTPRGWRRALRAANYPVLVADDRQADKQLMLELRRRFKGEVVALSEYLGRDLIDLWGYDDVH